MRRIPLGRRLLAVADPALEAFDGGDLFLAAEARQPSRQTAFGTSTAVEVELDGRTYSVLLYGEAGLDLSPGDWAAGLMQLQMTGGVLGAPNAADGARGYDLTAELLETPRVYRAGRHAAAALARGIFPGGPAAAFPACCRNRSGAMLPRWSAGIPLACPRHSLAN